MQTTEIRETWTALYARLSLDDGNVGESMSIQSQKAILTRKAEELGIYNYQFYVVLQFIPASTPNVKLLFLFFVVLQSLLNLLNCFF